MGKILATINSRFGRVRRETLNGRTYLVANFVSLRPRVLNGSKGRLFYPASEIAKNPGAWNHIPLTLGHPANPVTNLPESARQPAVLNRVKLGEIYEDAVENGERKGEAWFDEELTKSRSKVIWNILNAAHEGKTVPAIELSTGLFTDDLAHNGVASDGEEFDYVATNYRPDHLAVFEPGRERGACSVSDGCGIGVNAENDGQWVTTEHDNKLLIKDGDVVGGNPHVVKAAKKGEAKNEPDRKEPPSNSTPRMGKLVSWEPSKVKDIIRKTPALKEAAKKRGFWGSLKGWVTGNVDFDSLPEDSKQFVINVGLSIEDQEEPTKNAGNPDQPRDEDGRFAAGDSVDVHETATSQKPSGHSYPHRYAGRKGKVIEHNPEYGSVKVKFDDGGVVRLKDSQIAKNQETTMNEESPQSLVGRFVSWLVGNAGQTKNLEDGQFLPKGGKVSGKQVEAAVKRGWDHVSSSNVPPQDDPDDDGDEGEPKAGQGDRDEGQWREEAAESAPVVGNEDGGDSQSGRADVYAGFGRKKEGALERAAALSGSAEARSRAAAIMPENDPVDNGDILSGFKPYTGLKKLLSGGGASAKQTITETSHPPKAAPAPTTTPSAPAAPKAPASNLGGAPTSIESRASAASSAEPPPPPVSGTGMSGSPLSVGPTKNSHDMVLNCPECGAHMKKNADGKMGCNCGYTANKANTIDQRGDVPVLTPQDNPALASNLEVPMTMTDKQRGEAVGYLTTNCDCWRGKERVLANKDAFTDADLEKLVKNAKKAKADELVANAATRGVRVAGGTLTFNSQGRAVLNAKAEGSNADVTGGGDVQAGTEEEESDVDSSLEGQVDVGGTLAKGGGKGTTTNERQSTLKWLRDNGAPSWVINSTMSRFNAEDAEKKRLIGLLTANYRDEKVKARAAAAYGKHALTEIQLLAQGLPSVVRPVANVRAFDPVVAAPEPRYGYDPSAITPEPTENQGAEDEENLLPLPTNNWKVPA